MCSDLSRFPSVQGLVMKLVEFSRKRSMCPEHDARKADKGHLGKTPCIVNLGSGWS